MLKSNAEFIYNLLYLIPDMIGFNKNALPRAALLPERLGSSKQDSLWLDVFRERMAGILRLKNGIKSKQSQPFGQFSKRSLSSKAISHK